MNDILVNVHVSNQNLFVSNVKNVKTERFSIVCCSFVEIDRLTHTHTHTHAKAKTKTKGKGKGKGKGKQKINK